MSLAYQESGPRKRNKSSLSQDLEISSMPKNNGSYQLMQNSYLAKLNFSYYQETHSKIGFSSSNNNSILLIIYKVIIVKPLLFLSIQIFLRLRMKKGDRHYIFIFLSQYFSRLRVVLSNGYNLISLYKNTDVLCR